MSKVKSVGGQAVIEGVMMKSPRAWTVAVRDAKGVIHVHRERLRELPRALKLPLLRGVVTLFHALILGIKALEFSALKASEEEGEKPLSKTAVAFTIAAALVIGIGLFILLPLYATKLIGTLTASVAESSVLFNLVDGIVRVLVFLGYVFAIGLWKDMRRVFQYHGAEHKAIHAFEEGAELIPSGLGRFSPQHPRCGTSFLLIVMIVSIFVFSFIPNAWPFLFKFLSRLVLLPLIAGLSYELLKLSDRMKGNALVRALIAPGLMLQRLTTREPDEEQIEVALRALKEVLAMERSA